MRVALETTHIEQIIRSALQKGMTENQVIAADSTGIGHWYGMTFDGNTGQGRGCGWIGTNWGESSTESQSIQDWHGPGGYGQTGDGGTIYAKRKQ